MIRDFPNFNIGSNGENEKEKLKMCTGRYKTFLIFLVFTITPLFVFKDIYSRDLVYCLYKKLRPRKEW